MLLARFGEQHCPTHDLPTGSLTPEEIVQHILQAADGQTIAIVAPVAEAKKGVFKKELTAFATRGFLKAYVDGQVVPLAPVPGLGREEKHTIKVIVDYIKVKPQAQARLLRGVVTALEEGQGFGAFYPSDASGQIDSTAGSAFSAKGGCPRCGFAWPRLDARYFSANSLGKCASCNGFGAFSAEDDAGEDDSAYMRERTAQYEVCAACRGTGLDPKMNAVRLGGRTPQDLYLLPLAALGAFLAKLADSPQGRSAALQRVAAEVSANTARIVDVGLGYLTLSRRVRSLSGGEAQRLKLAGILAETLRGVMYVLDEPSQGLHPREIDRLLQALQRLKANGNTIMIVDHDEALMRGADWIVDLGPGGGARGGRIMAKFKPAEAAAFARTSVTARHLAMDKGLPGTPAHGDAAKPRGKAAAAKTTAISQPAGDALVVEGASLHNLKIDTVAWPVGALTAVTGVSGAGKSSLVLATLYPNATAAAAGGRKAPRHCRALRGFGSVTNVALVDRRPIAKSSVSLPASYLSVYSDLRDLYASLPDAQIMGLTARSFSLSVEGGRCPECKGKGQLSLSMRFLADARVPCPLCKGQRFQTNVLGVRYLGLSLAEVLELTLDEAVEHFKTHKKIVARLAPAVALGLGYLKLGQPTASLSGGEAQRLKLVPHLIKKHGAGSLIIMDEPTTGLHFEDVERLLAVLKRLTEQGATVVAIEHNGDVIRAADWVIEVGPGAAQDGGQLTYQGPVSGYSIPS